MLGQPLHIVSPHILVPFQSNGVVLHNRNCKVFNAAIFETGARH